MTYFLKGTVNQLIPLAATVFKEVRGQLHVFKCPMPNCQFEVSALKASGDWSIAHGKLKTHFHGHMPFRRGRQNRAAVAAAKTLFDLYAARRNAMN